MSIHSLLLAVLFSILVLSTQAQVKIEREYRIKEKFVPQQAQQFFDSLALQSKVKWYSEKSDLGQRIEAKTKFQGEYYSVRFDRTGTFLDLQVQRSLKTIDSLTQQAIVHSLNTQFKKWKVDKVQFQYQGSFEQVKQSVYAATDESVIPPSYEIDVTALTEDDQDIYQLLYSHSGDMLKKSIFATYSMTNLEF